MGMMQKQFADLITFTRASGGGRFNAQGQYEWLPANEPRIDYDPVTGECRGLLIEEQRTNLLTYSSDFANAAWGKMGATVVPSDTFGPDGTTKMLAIVETESAGWHGVQQIRPAATDSRTVSVFAKKGRRDWLYMRSGSASWGAVFFNLAAGEVGSRPCSGNPASASGIEDIGGGIYRCWATFPNTDTVPIRLFSSDVDGNIAGYVGEAGVEAIYIWGAQLEQGSFPTSLIHTADAQVTRAADVASVNELSPWFNASEGTLFVEWSTTLPQSGRNPRIAALVGSTDANRVDIHYPGGTGRVVEYVVSSGTASADITGGTTQQGAVNKLAASYKANDFGISLNGAATVTDSAGAVPSAITRLVIGGYRVAGYELNGHIKQFRYFPRRLSDSELQALTA